VPEIEEGGCAGQCGACERVLGEGETYRRVRPTRDIRVIDWVFLINGVKRKRRSDLPMGFLEGKSIIGLL